MDEATQYKHSFFLKKKLDQIEMISSWLKGLKDKYKIQVKFIQCDNARENKKLEEKCNVEGLGIIFEYTTTGTPQQNAYVESLSNNNGMSESNDELCWLYNQKA